MEISKTAMVRISRDPGQLFRLDYEPNAEMDLEGAKKTIQTILDSIRESNHDKFFLFVDGRKIKKISKEARKYLTSVKEVAAVGVLVGTGVSRMIGNFMITFNRPQYPIKLFSTEEPALAWLKTFG